MAATIVISSANHRRITFARAWLEARAPAEEVLIVGATPDAANELARIVVQTKGAAFGYHRMTLARLAVTLARPALAARQAVPLGRVGVEAVANRVVHKLAESGELGRYASLADGPGFARAIASVTTELRLEQIAPDEVAGVASNLSCMLQAPSLFPMRLDDLESHHADRLYLPMPPRWLKAKSTAFPSLVWCELTIVRTSSVFVAKPDIRSPHQRRPCHASHSVQHRTAQRRVARRFRFWWG
jgi:hypothetical protein